MLASCTRIFDQANRAASALREYPTTFSMLPKEAASSLRRDFCPQEVCIMTFVIVLSLSSLETQNRPYSHFTDKETNSEKSNDL